MTASDDGPEGPEGPGPADSKARRRQLLLRRISRGLGGSKDALRVFSVESEGSDRAAGRSRRWRQAVIGVQSRGMHTPADAIASAIRNALDPVLAPAPVTTLADMSPEKRAELERLYAGRKRGGK